jgi:integrase
VAGTVRYAKLDSPTARAKLKRGDDERGRKHWQSLNGRAHLGYQRKPGAANGRWLLRRYDGKAYAIEPLGAADDGGAAADGESVLSYEQAKAKARAALNIGAKLPGRLTVRQAIADYIKFMATTGKATKDTEWRATAHILPKLGDIEVAALTSEKIREWLHALASAPALARTKKGQKQNYKAAPADDAETVRRRRSSANRVLNVLKAALNHAFDEKRVAQNDAWGRRVKPFEKVDVARVRYLTVGEAKRLLNASDPKFRPLVQAALETGARYGELTRLEVADFNPDAGTITIRQSKSGKPRHIVLTDEGTAFFRDVCAGRARNAVIFERPGGGPWRASHQSRPMKEASANAKLSPPVSFHALRHTWASLSVMAGVPLIVVARNLGHADTKMTERHYGHLASSFIVDAIRAGAPKFGFKAGRKVVALERAK